jgi:hypothetical protein
VSRYDRNWKRGLRFTLAFSVIGALIALGYAYDTLATRPAVYRDLRTRGVLTQARVHCKRDCTLTYVYAGRTHENDYANDTSQFRAPFALVYVDPRHPSTMYTVRDVQFGTNAGFGVLSVFCLVFAAFLVGLAALCGYVLWRFVPLSELRLDPPKSIPESYRAALIAIDDTQDMLWDGSLPTRWTVRLDRERVTAAVAYLCERLAAVPGLDSRSLGLGRELAEAVDDARPALIGHAIRVDPEPLHLRLDELRLGVVAAARRC